MKRIFTNLFVAVLLMLSSTSWAQSETRTITVIPSDGAYNRDNWSSKWESTADGKPKTVISVSDGINNINSNQTGETFQFFVGQSSPSTWNFTVDGCVIVSYSFDFTSVSNSITITAGDKTMKSDSSSQEWSVDGLNTQSVSFQLSGGNNGIVVSNLTFEVREILEEGQVYMFKNARPDTDRSLSADGTNDVHTKTTDVNDTKQQWYVTKDGDYYVLRNLACGKYLKGNGQSSAWNMTDDYSHDYNKFELYVSNTTYNTLHTKTLGTHAYMHDSNNGDNGGYEIVGWSNADDAAGSHWTITKVDYTSDEITALLEKAPTVAESAAYITSLEALFADAACVTPALGSLSAAQATEAYNALPTTLKAMVDKVYNEKTEGVVLETAWSEDNANAEKEGWSGKYAKKFRVQMYEPYSIAGDITSWLGINAHANNDNPTGIHVPEAGTLYVMVEGEIKPGATLRLVNAGSNDRITNAATGGIALQPGLNVINYTGSTGMLYICYNVDTYDPSGTDDETKFRHKLSDFAPLKIHIEGGAINGFYNACGDFRASAPGAADDLWYQYSGASVDKDDDWVYMETRANLSVLPILGHRQILLFSLGETEGNNGMAHYLPENITVPQTPYNRTKNWSDYGMGCDPKTGRINIMVEAWDRIMYSELATMGLVSKSDMAKMNEFYPRWNADGTVAAEIYDYSGASHVDGQTLEQFCGVDYGDVFNHHGVALGVGGSSYMYGGGDHCGYNHNTMNGVIQTIASNAGSTWGPGHEIGHQHQALLTLNGLMEVTNNLFSNIALWYKGMSTSRYNGSDGSLEKVLEAFNTNGGDTYTNNIWALTHMYYRLWLYYHLAGNNTQFYPRLFELLRHDPMKRTYMQDGDVSMLHFYKLVCQAAGEDLTEFFRAHGYFKVMENRLVGDYSNSIYNVSQDMIDAAIAEVKAMNLKENLSIIFINDDDDDENANYLQHDGKSEREIYGETTPNSDFGSVSDFINGNVSVATNYTATLNSDGTLTMSGGEGGVGFLVLNEEGEIVSFSNKSTFALSDEAAYLLATGKASVVAVDTESTTTEAEVDVTAMRFALLQELIENANTIIANVDETQTRVGYYKSDAVKNLAAYVEMAEQVIENGDFANLQAVYELLYAEYNAVVANEYSRVKFVPGSKYAIINKSGRIMSVLDDGKVTTVDGSSDYTSTEVNQWTLERDVAFRVKNVGKNAYLQEVTDQNGVRFTVAQPVVDYNITEVELGWYALACSKVPSRYMNKDGADATKVITWGSMGDDNSQWKFILLEENETNAAKEDLLELAKKTLALVDEVATVNYTQGDKIALQSTNSGIANYIWSNAAVQGNDVDKLLDGNKDSFFHSQWNNSTAPADGWGHHLTVYLGDNPSLTSFKFKFTTRNQSNLSNYPKTIEVYGSNVGGNDVANYTKLQAASGFATGKGVDNEVVVMGNGTAYRYLRFLVTDATGNNSGTNTGSDGMVFFHMSEFSIYPVTVSATVKSDYTSGVTVDAVLAAYNDAEQGKTVYNNASATLADINAKKTALGDGADVAGSYTTLLAQYNNLMNSVLEAKKTELLTLITNTNSLIESVGSVEFADVPLKLTTENLYCNDPCLRNDNDYSADYVDKLTDGNHSTYLHTDWDGSNSAGNAPHYLRVDMGEVETITQFKFSYTTRNDGRNCPTAIVVEGSNDAGGNGTYTTITTLTKDANGLPENYATFNSETITSTVPYRYIRFRVTATKSGDSFFVMSEFSFTKANQPVVTMTNTSTKADEALVFDTYLATAKSQKLHDAATTVALLDAAIADQQAAYDALEKAKNTPADLDKAALQSLYGDALALYGEMADAEGNVNADYAPSALTNEKLVAVKAALDAAKGALDNSNSQTEVDEVKTALQAQYDALLEIKNANVATTIDKSGLNTAIANANTLIAAIEAKGEGYYATTNLALDELQEALAAANDAATRFYLTEEQYTETLTQLNNCYTTTNGIVALDCNSENRKNLSTLIGNVNALLTVIADAGENTLALPLQTTNANADFYIKLSVVGDGNIANIIDKKSDGSANTGTYVGSAWGGTIADYTHYVQVDLGADCSLDELSFDYATRSDGNFSTERPTAIKVLGSNDGNEFTEVTTLTEGLATGAGERSALLSVELGKHYRYIRFAVKSGVNSFHMSDFNLYTTLSHTLKEYYTTAEGLDLTTLCFVLDEAKDAAAHYMTTEQYTAVYNKLSGCYTTADEIICNDYTDRNALATLKTDASTLVNNVVAINETETKIALQCTDENAPYYIYCNAPGATNNYPGDNLGVAALLDVDEGGEPITATFLHSSYVAGSHDDNLDHYLRVDMGEAMALRAFKFRYTPRIGNTGNAPLVMLIEGSNDCVNFEEITTLTNMATTYESGEITNGKAYRYIRFMVKTTVNNDVHNGHPYFAMSHFEMTACNTLTINQGYASPNLSVNVAADAYNELFDANALDAEHYLPSEVGTTAKDELQDAYNALYAALQMKNIPVKLTTDENNPVLYKIKIKSNEKVFTYDGQSGDASKNPILSVDALGNKYQAWYFMKGNDDNSNDDILILPYYHEGAKNTTHKLGYPDISGSTKPVVSETGASSYNWYITFTSTGNNVTTEGWWNLQPQDGTSDNTYVNQQGGSGSTILSFWKSASNPNDNGSQFQFILDETDYSLSDAYYALYNKHAEFGGTLTGGEAIGDYTVASVVAYNEAYNNAGALLETKTSTDDVYTTARETLASSFAAIEYVMPEEGKLYKIRSISTQTYCSGKYVHALCDTRQGYTGQNHKHLVFDALGDITQLPLAVFTFEDVNATNGECIMKNLHTGMYVKSFNKGEEHMTTDYASAAIVKIGNFAPGQAILRIGNDNPMHAQDANRVIVSWGAAAENASLWSIDEVTDISQVVHNVTMSAKFSSVMLGYNATVPAGVEAYNAEGVEDGYVTLVELAREGEVIPANTPVILYRTDDATSKTFTYTTTSAEVPESTVLGGSLYQKFVKCDDKKDYYKLMIKSGEAKMYWMYKEFNAAGVSQGENNDGGHIKCSANKIYMALPAEQQAASFGMRFKEPETTGVEEVKTENGNVKTIYDLQGRKLTEITEPGFYIINGKKVYVK